MSAPDASRLALFIDGANIHATARTLGFDMDYRRLLAEFSSRGTVLRAFYYTTTIEDLEYSSVRPLLDWLGYNGYTVVTRPAKESVDSEGRRKLKGSISVPLAIDAIEIAPHVDEILLFSRARAFRSVVKGVQRRGVGVRVVSTFSTQPPMIADELRRQADGFIDLADLQSRIGRDPAGRPAREAGERAPRARTP